MIKLGMKAKDIITDREGIITAKAEYLTGCTQYAVTGKEKDSYDWVDEGRLLILDKTPIKLIKKDVSDGGPQQTPNKH